MTRNPERELAEFREFLESIPLARYREETKDVKWVEQDLPKEILPQDSIFRYYWEERRFLNFDDWFEEFWKEINARPESKKALQGFKKYFFDKTGNGWFKKGFRARMYRTWVSVLTQLDFCYVFESVCSEKKLELKLECNAILDTKYGIDVKVNEIPFQIAKISQRKEARTAGGKKRLITIPYAVFDLETFQKRSESQRVKDKDGYRKAIESFNKYFLRLANGFIVFKPEYLRPIIDNIDSFEKVKEIVEKISRELAGE